MLYASGRIVEVACWAHGRRRFKESVDTDPRAGEVLLLVQQLSRSRAAKELSAEARRALRQARSVPVLAKIDEVRRRLHAEVLPKSPLGDALRYHDNQWAPLPPANVDPFLYVRDVLRRLPTHPQRLIGQLTPRGWAENFAATA